MTFTLDAWALVAIWVSAGVAIAVLHHLLRWHDDD